MTVALKPTWDDILHAMTLPGWTWMEGMLDSIHQMRVIGVLSGIGAVELLMHGRANCTVTLFRSRENIRWMEMRPDLTDPATTGCLLHLLILGGPSDPPVEFPDGDPYDWTPGEVAVWVALRRGYWIRRAAP